jgi:large subunit ribosomal protein L10
MARSDKADAVAELTEQFRSSPGAVLTEYRGLTVKQLQDLRRSLGENATYAVVKNTLTQLAVREAGVDSFDGLLTGPSAIAFIKGDPVVAAKGLRDFAKAHPPLVIKGGVLDGKTLTADEIAKIADLESREVLLGKLAGVLKASLQNAVSLFQAPLAQTARLAAALQETKSDGAETEQAEGAAQAEAAAAPETAADEAQSDSGTAAEETPAAGDDAGESQASSEETTEG